MPSEYSFRQMELIAENYYPTPSAIDEKYQVDKRSGVPFIVDSINRLSRMPSLPTSSVSRPIASPIASTATPVVNTVTSWNYRDSYPIVVMNNMKSRKVGTDRGLSSNDYVVDMESSKSFKAAAKQQREYGPRPSQTSAAPQFNATDHSSAAPPSILQSPSIDEISVLKWVEALAKQSYRK